MNSSNWHTNPRTLIAMIVFIFGLGMAWTTVSYKVVALEAAVKKHEKTPERLLRLEIELGYIRKSNDDIKGIVQSNARNFNAYIIRERARRNGTSD